MNGPSSGDGPHLDPAVLVPHDAAALVVHVCLVGFILHFQPGPGFSCWSEVGWCSPCDCGVGVSLQAVTALGFKQPTPIQKACVPVGLLGRDLCACAATGTGNVKILGPVPHTGTKLTD